MTIHILGDGPEVVVWLDRDRLQDGVPIERGATTHEAIQRAIRELHRIIDQLRFWIDAGEHR